MTDISLFRISKLCGEWESAQVKHKNNIESLSVSIMHSLKNKVSERLKDLNGKDSFVSFFKPNVESVEARFLKKVLKDFEDKSSFFDNGDGKNLKGQFIDEKNRLHSEINRGSSVIRGTPDRNCWVKARVDVDIYEPIDVPDYANDQHVQDVVQEFMKDVMAGRHEMPCLEKMVRQVEVKHLDQTIDKSKNMDFAEKANIDAILQVQPNQKNNSSIDFDR